MSEYHIIFRPVCHDRLPPQASRVSHYWHVEAYHQGDGHPMGGWSWPVGIAFVRDSSDVDRFVTMVQDAEQPWRHDIAVELQYIIVLGDRRSGIGTALYRAVMERWPHAYCDAATADGTAFLEAMAREATGRADETTRPKRKPDHGQGTIRLSSADVSGRAETAPDLPS